MGPKSVESEEDKLGVVLSDIKSLSSDVKSLKAKMESLEKMMWERRSDVE